MTSECRNHALKYLGLKHNAQLQCNDDEPIIWLRSAKVPYDGECLADKGFENTDRYYAHLNRVRCPRMLRNRDVKQCDVIELMTKGEHCRLRHTSEVNFSFFEHLESVKDYVPWENIRLLPYAIECGYAHVNLQQPLRKPGVNSQSPLYY